MNRLSSDRLESIGLDDEIAGTGLTVGAMQGVARRQLIGSVAVAIFVAAVAGLAAIKPARIDTAAAPTRGFAVVQQPILTTPTGQHIAATKNMFP